MIRTTLLVLLLTFGAFPVSASQWEKVTDRDGIQVYRAHDANSRLKTFRGVARLQVRDFSAIGVLLDDYDAVARFLHMVSDIVGVKRHSHYKRDVYITTHLPWPVHDRDAPLRVTFHQDPQTLDLVMPFTLAPSLVPPRDGYVRMPQMDGYFLFEPIRPGVVRATIEVVLDPGGSLPAWLANIILRDIPYFSLKRLRRMINQPRFQGVDHGYYKTPESWLHAGERVAGKGSVSTTVPN